MFEGWLTFAGVELVNNERTMTYSRALAITDLGCYDCCGTLASYLGDLPYAGVCADPAPWFDPAVPASGRFAGFYGLAVSGLSRSTGRRQPVDLIAGGAAIGGIRGGQREMTWSVLAAAAGDDALSYGMSWLAGMLRGSMCAGGCGGDAACLMAYCPCTDGSAGPGSDPMRNMFNVGLLEMDEPHSHRILSGASMLAQVDFTLVAGVPYVFWPPVALHEPALALAAGPHGMVARTPPRQPREVTLADLCLDTSECMADPLCPDPAPPPPPPVPTPADEDCDCVQLPTVKCTVVFTGGGSAGMWWVDASASVASGDPRLLRVTVEGNPGGTMDVVTGATAVRVWNGAAAGSLKTVIADVGSATTVNTALARAGGALTPAPQSKTLYAPVAVAPLDLTAVVSLTAAHELVATVTSPGSGAAGRQVRVAGGALGVKQVAVNAGQAALSGVLAVGALPYTAALTFTDIASGERVSLAPQVSAPAGVWQVAPAQISWSVPFWFTRLVELPAALIPESAQRALVIDIWTGSLPIRCLQVEWYVNAAGRPCPDVVGDACSLCASFQIGYIPAGASLVIDGRTQTATVDCPGAGAGLTDATASMRTPTGAPYSWPTFDCALPMCVRVSATQRAEDAVFTIMATGREDAI